MVEIIINGRPYRCPDGWGDVTIRQCMEIEELLDADVGVMRGMFDGSKDGTQGEDHTGCDRDRICRAILPVLLSISPADMQECGTDELERAVREHLSWMIAGIIDEPAYEPECPEKFICAGKTYFFPGSRTDVSGRKMMLADTSAGEFCDASQLYNQRRIADLPYIMALLCRAGNKGAEDSLAREFRSLPMSIAWEFYYALHSTHRYLSQEYPLLYSRGMIGPPDGQRVEWTELPYYCAWIMRISVEEVERMNCYKFLKLLNVGLNVKRAVTRD